jgi:hypothetical protein
MKKIVKLCVIREDGERKCPFGLPINEACETVGSSIEDMCPLKEVENEEEKELVSKANNRIFIFDKQSDKKKGKCKYANVIFDNDKVECNFGDYAAGLGSATFNAEPMQNSYMDIGFYSVPFNSNYLGVNHYFFAEEKNDLKKDGDDE